MSDTQTRICKVRSRMEDEANSPRRNTQEDRSRQDGRPFTVPHPNGSRWGRIPGWLWSLPVFLLCALIIFGPGRASGSEEKEPSPAEADPPAPLDEKSLKAAVTIFEEMCAICHEEGGAAEDPKLDLTDGQWLHGGTLADIKRTINEGIEDTLMKPLQDKFTAEEIENLARYVLTLAPAEPTTGAATKEPEEKIVLEGPELKLATAVFEEMCSICHEEDGNAEIPELNLINGVWRYGDSLAEITETIRQGIPDTLMKPMEDKLTDKEIEAVAKYVKLLAGDDATTATAVAEKAEEPSAEADEKP